VVSSPSSITGGGGLRALRSLREYIKYFKKFLIIPWGLWDDKETLRSSIIYLREIQSLNVKFTGFFQLPGILYKVRRVLGSSIFDRLTPLIMPEIAKVKIPFGRYEAIIVLHKN
jgi:hypothetical protein